VSYPRLFRLYQEEKLAARPGGGHKQAIDARTPMLIPLAFGVCLLAFALQVVIHFMIYKIYLDDAYIFMRYVDNFNSGHGLVFNLDEKVIGFSSVAYPILLGLFGRVIPVSLPIVTFIFAAICWGGASFGLARTDTLKRRTAWCLLAFWCLYQPFLDAAVNGMETMLFAALTVLLINIFVRKSYDSAAFLALILPLVRPEGIGLSIAVLVALPWQSRSLYWWRGLLAGAVLVGLWVWFATATYGSPIPQSMLAKSQTTTRDWVGASSVLASMAIAAPTAILLSLPGVAKLACYAIGIIAIFFAGFQAVNLFQKQSPKAIVPMGYVLICLFFVVGRPVVIWTWYPIVPCLLLSWTIAFALEDQIERLDYRRFLLIASGGLSLLLVLAVLGTKVRNSRLDAYGRSNLAVVNLIRSHSPDAKSYMCSDIGIPAYYLKIKINDLAGLVTKQMLDRSPSGDFLSFGALIESKKPDVVALREDIFSGEEMGENFVYRRSFSSNRNQAANENAYIKENYVILKNANPYFPIVLISKALYH
jgi:hypothetical protein